MNPRTFRESVIRSLTQQGFSDPDMAKVRTALLESIPDRTYDAAVLFIGWVTVLLVVGSFGLLLTGKSVPEPLWGIVGACVGGLAGIFTGSK